MPRVFAEGSNEYLTASAPLTVAPLTMAAWFNQDAGSAGAFDVLVALGQLGAAADEFWELSLNNANTWVDAYMDEGATGDQLSRAPGTYSTGAWSHGALTENGTVLTGYLAGAPDATPVTHGLGAPAGIDTLTIGARANNETGRIMDGSVFWAAIWNTDLDATDAARLANGVEPTFVRRDALVFFARLMADEDQDIIGGLAMTPAGTPTVSNDFPATMVRALPRGRSRDRHRFT